MTEYVPLVLQVPDFKAQLNQDGTWTVEGELSVAGLHAGPPRWIAEKLLEHPPENNPTPNNSKPISFREMTDIALADPAAWAWVSTLEVPLEAEFIPQNVTRAVGYVAQQREPCSTSA